MSINLNTVLLEQDVVRLLCFAAVLIVMLSWELAAPKRGVNIPRRRRWLNNLGLMVLNTVLLRLLFPTAAFGIALYTQTKQWGLFNQLEVPLWAAFLICLVALDFVIYLQHRLFHTLPVLWRIHRVHHADREFDVSTGVRFHPIEIVLSMIIKGVAIIILGAPAQAVVAFEVILSATSLFNHGNVRLHRTVETYLRWMLVTPDMHRVHHSIDMGETNHNFGFNLSCWDRLFNTYRAQPRQSHETMAIGVKSLVCTRVCQGLWGMLTMPFVKNTP